ncbi:vWA domain-containing protein [Levilactobacillus sp. HBUAS70063]|uniref:vWA domain-containing protein n=1 Tax=Levilactobacillus sp. HBUAS70063 TaxID=3109359 RepID=UPI003132FCD4
MPSLTQDLKRLATGPAAQQDANAHQAYRDAVMYLLQTDPFYGRVLSQMTVEIAPGHSPLALRPTATDWRLRLAPAALGRQDWTGTQWVAMLRHTVLHLLWQHPQRYAEALKTPAQAGLVRWATDAAVNDYLTDLPTTAITSRRLQQLIGQPVQRQQDSAVYLRQLRDWRAKHPASARSLPTGGPANRGDQVARRSAEAGNDPSDLDGHATWRAADATAAATREQWRRQLFQRTADSLTAKQRGTLPGAMRAALTPTVAEQPLDWRRLLKRGLGQVPAGRQPAFGRFNRRQPARMELPGQIVTTWQKISVFVDESGSMGNREISYLLGQLATLLAVYPAQVTVYPFDTVVDPQRRFSLQRRPQHLMRTGGGGTRFQAVFDALPRLLQGAAGQLVIILTDGYGERQLQPTLPVPVIWLLTSPVAAFSVKNAPGTVVSLTTDPQWQAIRGQKS